MAFVLFQKFIEGISPAIFKGVNGLNLVQSIFGLPGNLISEAARLATKLPWTKSPEQPPDALDLVGAERLLGAMPLETAVSYQSRLADAWNIWPKAGNPATIEQVLASGGYPLTVIERQDWPAHPPVPYWSIFWLVDYTGSIKAEPPTTYGGGAVYGQDGIFWGATAAPGYPLTEVLASICLAVNRTRPAHVILGDITIPGTAPLYATPGLTYGGGALYGGTAPIVINC